MNTRTAKVTPTRNRSCTHDIKVAEIAIRLHPETYVSYDKEMGACFEWAEEDDDVKDAIKETQKIIIGRYWKSKTCSRGISEVLIRFNSLSDFGKALYEKILEEEKFKRYSYKKQLRQLEELL